MCLAFGPRFSRERCADVRFLCEQKDKIVNEAKKKVDSAKKEVESEKKYVNGVKKQAADLRKRADDAELKVGPNPEIFWTSSRTTKRKQMRVGRQGTCWGRPQCQKEPLLHRL